MKSRNKHRVALVVIARDEAPQIARLLDSVAEWVDEMVLLDTGSMDDTAAIAQSCGARVHHFDWCNDFAAARNCALIHASAEWHLVLDADEWLVDGGDALKELSNCQANFVGAIRLEDQGCEGGIVRNWLSRVLPGHLRYQGAVHEQPIHDLPVHRLPLVIRHDGYAPERLASKRGRNRPLLQSELALRPLDAYLWFHLGKDHTAYEEYEQAARAYAQADSLRGIGIAWCGDLAARHLFALKRLRRHGEAIAYAEKYLAHCGDSPDFYFALGDVLLDWTAESPSEAPTLLPMALAAWQRCLEIGERPDLCGSVAGRGSFLAAHNLAVVYEGLGLAEEAATWRARFPRP